MCCFALLEEKILRVLPVTPENRKAVEGLRVTPEQTEFIETVSQCLAEADALPLWRPVAIYDEDLLIGFAMYGLWKEEGTNGRVWLDRFLIDAAQQGKGYAKPALWAVLAQIADTYHHDQVYLSIYENNTHALRIYEELGFIFTGELDINGEKVMLLPAAPSIE